MTAIIASDIVYLLSVPWASAGHSAAGIAGTSWGNYCSNSVLSSTALDNLFTDITGAENVSGQVDYACMFIWNNTQSGNSMRNTRVWLPSQLATTGGASLLLATDNIGITPLASTLAQAATIGSAIQVPQGTSGYVAPTSSSSGGLAAGTVAPGNVFAVWLQRTATNSAPLQGDTFQVQVDFDTNS